MNETKLFVARSKPFGLCEKGMVHLFADKPYRCNNGMGMEYWRCDSPYEICLGEYVFPNLKWEDEPFPIELNEVPSVDAIEKVLTCIAEYYADVFRNGVQPEEFRREQAQMIREYITMYYDYWLPMNETKLFVARSKPFGLCENGMVHLFDDKPYRYNNGMGMEYWRCDSPYEICLGEYVFPNLKWEDEPFPIELNEVPSVDTIENVLTCIAEYYADVFRNGVQPEEFRREQAQMIREYITMYYDYWLPMNERGVELPRTKSNEQDEEEVQTMKSN